MPVRRGLWRGRFLVAVLAVLLDGACAAEQVRLAPFVPAPGSPIAVAGGPGNVALADLDRDRKLDLVVATGRNRGVTVFLGRGDGRFRAAAGGAIELADAPSELVVADFDGDGRPDLAVGHHDSYGVTLLLGDGAGGFARAPGSPVVTKQGRHPHTHGLEAGDVDGDGKIDLVAFNSNPDDDVSVLLGDGRGGFRKASGSPVATGKGAWRLAVGDLDGDGKPDVATSNLESDSVTVLLAR